MPIFPTYSAFKENLTCETYQFFSQTCNTLGITATIMGICNPPLELQSWMI